MFFVTDITIEPEDDDIHRGWIDPEAVVHLALENAVTDLIKRIRFSLGYELDTELGAGEPDLPADAATAIADWRKRFDQDGPGGVGALRVKTRDYQHLLLPLEVL